MRRRKLEAMTARLLLIAALLTPVAAQTECPPTPNYSPCDLVFELDGQEAAAHPNPYLTLQLHGEFRSPSKKTFLMHAFWDGGRRVVIRFAPNEVGEWDYRLTSNVARFSGKTGQFTATPSDAQGFVRVNNVRHFSYTEDKVRPIPHLWMGDTMYRFAAIDRGLFETIVDARAAQKFNHIRGLVMGNFPGLQAAYRDPDNPNPEYFRELDQRILYMNKHRITADLLLGGDQNHLAEAFPSFGQRERYVRYVASRYSAMNITWQGVQEFEEYEDGRALLKEIGTLLGKYDPYRHLRSTHTVATSAPLLGDGWMDYIAYQSSDDALGAIEHQLYARPQVNTEFAYEDSGAGKSHPHHVDTDTFRKRLWNAAMNGQYPTFGNTGTYGGRKFEPDAKYLDSPGARQMTHWFDFFSNTRHWELEPYFELDGGRALALTGIEYIVYLEKPGPVQMTTEKQSYNVYWFNPITGESVKEKKDYKGTTFSGQPPDQSHDWVLHLSRDDRKRGMLNRWYFESRRVPIQEVELDPRRLPYEVAAPSADELPVGAPVQYEVKLTRESRATSSMMYLWTGEVTGGADGFRVLATGDSGTLQIPEAMVKRFPATLTMRIFGMNLLGKVYSVNRVYSLAK
ncbi:MAG: DUF4038 domain-containing protein [Bryobacteraceae bacterium]|nr:DUF4038 domain-containing protein [Bryobacteraceae bacterium]